MDLAVFCQTFLNGGRYGDTRLLSRAAVTEMTRNQIPGTGVVTFDRVWFPEASWGLGWMVQGSNRWKYDHGALQPVGTFYHQGMGGIGVWGDKSHDIVGVYQSVGAIKDMETMDTDWEFPAFQNMVTAAVVD
jgi:CubicO group peptidase (beta-lactamase class C family)